MSSNTPGVGLERGALGLPTVLMQSVAQIAPAVGILATIAFNTDLAGLGAPSTYLVAFLIAVVSAIALGQLAKHLPSAGGFYTYVSATVGPEAGFMVGWLYSWFVAAIPGALAAYTGFVLHGELDDQYGVNIPWWVFAVAILGAGRLRRLPRHPHLRPRADDLLDHRDGDHPRAGGLRSGLARVTAASASRASTPPTRPT